VQARLTVSRTLRTRAPFGHCELLAFLAPRVVPGVERVGDGTYHRTLALPGGPAVISATPGARTVKVLARVGDEADVAPALDAVRRIFDLGAEPAAIDAVLAGDALLAPLVAARPGLRVPGTADGAELLVRAITGQQVSVAGAHTTLGRITARHGDALPEPVAGLTHLFPAPARLARADPAALGMPRARGAAIVAASRACAEGLRLQPGVSLAATRAQLLALPGVGPWTADYVAMRALGDRDAYMPTDLGVRHALVRLGDADPDRWRPYRSHALQHLWAILG
jgi:AraC family transcriptional regulator of adaptative response / DNA-3-methyladenine glycosylase II